MNGTKIQTNQILKAIWESADDAIISKDLNGVILSWNKGAENIYGYSEKQMVGKSIDILYPPERVDELKEILERLKKGEKIYHYNTVRIKKNGEKIDISLTTSPIYDKDNTLIGAVTMARDVTKEQRQKKFEVAIDAAPNGIIMINRAGTIELINLQICKMFGYVKEELLGKKIELLVPDRLKVKHPEHRMNFFVKPQTRLMGVRAEIFRDEERMALSFLWKLD